MMFTAGNTPLAICITTKTEPDTEEIRCDAKNKVYTLLKSKETVSKLAQDLRKKFEATVIVDNVRLGSIMIDLVLEDLSKVEYIKYLSDNWVLSNIVDNILITPEFISSCQAKDVALDVLIDEESYKKIKSLSGKKKS